MLEIDFEPTDIAGVRIVGTVGPLAEAVLAMGAVRRGGDRWATRVAGRQSRAEADLVRYLRPMRHVGVDLVTLGGLAARRDQAREALLDCPSEWFAHEMRCFTRRDRTAPAWLERAGHPDRRTHHEMVDHVSRWYDRHVSSHWSDVRRELDRHHARLGHRLAGGGVDGLLGGLGHGTSWDGRRLRITDGAEWRHEPLVAPLHGRGLVLAPSYFAAAPETYFPIDPAGPAVLVVPISTRHRGGAERLDRDGVSGVLGRTRAAVLVALAGGEFSTSELAAHLDISLSGASQHTAALRAAGLATRSRDGRRVRHAATALGRALGTATPE